MRLILRPTYRVKCGRFLLELQEHKRWVHNEVLPVCVEASNVSAISHMVRGSEGLENAQKQLAIIQTLENGPSWLSSRIHEHQRCTQEASDPELLHRPNISLNGKISTEGYSMGGIPLPSVLVAALLGDQSRRLT